jgi:hypothetical protein
MSSAPTCYGQDGLKTRDKDLREEINGVQSREQIMTHDKGLNTEPKAQHNDTRKNDLAVDLLLEATCLSLYSNLQFI